MQRDSVYVYAVEAFRFHARCGKVSAEEYRQSIYNTAFNETEIAELKGIQAHNAVVEQQGAIYDIEAVSRTLDILSLSGKMHIVKAVESIYFTMPNKPLTACQLACRVRRFSVMCPASERTVYRWLKTARDIFAWERGLNTHLKRHC